MEQLSDCLTQGRGFHAQNHQNKEKSNKIVFMTNANCYYIDPENLEAMQTL